eukprot:CAMPEP_0184333410 /NCGR_PEP_ID=MMETSP1089-20130417/2406_1 /TAXON_ID=38269 ORGANISM="Gloeochaete wittrockiana, Strain SAG46.84" /NCGR_SAMPLE_ID=MMETSP1089 /ASSEMBLY_ACC=CAM_ASM_000445 /LENGTH=171 /DNA_ID=CAMNT_0026657221 /DNA_START=63 /DNA_END=578 /DNA_ORIENTATION=-
MKPQLLFVVALVISVNVAFANQVASDADEEISSHLGSEAEGNADAFESVAAKLRGLGPDNLKTLKSILDNLESISDDAEDEGSTPATRIRGGRKLLQLRDRYDAWYYQKSQRLANRQRQARQRANAFKNPDGTTKNGKWWKSFKAERKVSRIANHQLAHVGFAGPFARAQE